VDIIKSIKIANMQFKTEKKKNYTALILIGCACFLIVGGAIYYFVSIRGGKWSYVQQKNNEVVAEKEKALFLDYKNQKYSYLVKYPSDWHISSTDAESDLAAPDPESGISYLFGGQAFWSNYANIDDYDPQNKPADFRLLGLTIYQGNDELVDDFAKKIGIFENATKVDFETEKHLPGTQFIFTGLTKNDLKVTVIFKKDKLFYVFKTAFIDGDEGAAETMENIVKSFSFQS
jgi:hypothetical protein